jgi:hypothetical protein
MSTNLPAIHPIVRPASQQQQHITLNPYTSNAASAVGVAVPPTRAAALQHQQQMMQQAYQQQTVNMYPPPPQQQQGSVSVAYPRRTGRALSNASHTSLHQQGEDEKENYNGIAASMLQMSPTPPTAARVILAGSYTSNSAMRAYARSSIRSARTSHRRIERRMRGTRIAQSRRAEKRSDLRVEKERRHVSASCMHIALYMPLRTFSLCIMCIPLTALRTCTPLRRVTHS